MNGASVRGIRAAQVGMVINAALAGVKLTAGIVGNTYALVADAIESGADVFASLIVWGGLAIGAQPADEDHPYGHGKAEALATAAVSFMLLGAAIGIAFEAVREIRTPHLAPAPWTLAVLVTVMAIKWILSRRVAAVSAEIGSSAVKADAAHHLSDRSPARRRSSASRWRSWGAACGEAAGGPRPTTGPRSWPRA